MTKYSQLFLRKDGNTVEDQYLFCANLGSGASGAAQLVLHVDSNKPCVRKTASPRLTAEQMNHDLNIVERRVMEYLQSQSDEPPHLVGLWDAEDVYPSTGEKPFRVLYLNYCNGGDLEQLRDLLAANGMGMARRLILRLVKQMSVALNYLYTRADPILHRDFKMDNIFCHWHSAGDLRFYLGDFGFSSMGDTKDAKMDLVQFVNVIQGLSALPGPRPGCAQDTPALTNLLVHIFDEIRAQAEDDSTHEDALPDLGNLMALVAQIPDELVSEPWREYNRHGAHDRAVVPLYHDSRAECLAPHTRGTAVHGPWHVARVRTASASPSPSSGRMRLGVDVRGGAFAASLDVSVGGSTRTTGPQVLDWEPQTYHRPHRDSDYPVSEEDDDM